MSWIPTKKQLPKLGDRFDAWVNGQYEPNCGAYVGNWSEDDRRESMLVKGITHWRPLPEPPQYDWKLCDQKVNGSCPHHNLHCGFPKCEQVLFDTKSIER